VVTCLEQGADCLHIVQLMPLHLKTPSSLASFKSRLVLPFWYQLTEVVVEKRRLNGCSSSSSSSLAVLCLWYIFAMVLLASVEFVKRQRDITSSLAAWLSDNVFSRINELTLC